MNAQQKKETGQDDIPFTRKTLWQVCVWLVRTVFGIYMAGAAFWANTVIVRFDRNETKLSNLEKLTAEQNTSIAEMRKDISYQEELRVKYEVLLNDLHDLELEVERLKKK